MNNHQEHYDQCTVFQWAGYKKARHPELALLYAVPNSGHGGKGNVRKGVWLKAEGLKSGVPDICLPVARQGHHGLYIEMKVGKNKPTDNQKWWLDALAEQGYRTEVADGSVEAIAILMDYLGVKTGIDR